MLLLDVIAAYALVGVVIAVPFVTFGITRVLPHTSATAGARLFLVPGVAAFWPVVLGRWLMSRKTR